MISTGMTTQNPRMSKMSRMNTGTEESFFPSRQISISFSARKRHSFFSYTTAALLMSGGIGNLIDRIAHGFVVDYIHVLFFDYVFNFADCCITVGAVLFVIHVLFFTREGKETLPREPGSK